MKKVSILILNCDFERSSSANEGNIFRDYLLKKSGVRSFKVFNVYQNFFPKESDLIRYDGIIITGSNASVYDSLPWIKKLFKLVKKIDQLSIPTMGICFGHQAVAEALGGKVVNSGGEERGFKRIFLTTAGKKNLLFKGLPKVPVVCTWHQDIVSKLPKGGKVFARNNFSIQSFGVRNFFCTQFHPEFSPKISKLVAIAEGVNPSVFGKINPLAKKQIKVLDNFIRMFD